MLERNSSVSMYAQIVDMLKEEIFRKKIPADGCLGTQKDLADKYGVSLITIRKALQLLEEQGIVVIKQGKGTFVSRNLLANRHNFFSNYVDVTYGEDNSEQNTKISKFGEIDTPPHLSSHLAALLGPRCVFTERVYTFNGRVSGRNRSYIPVKYGRQLDFGSIKAKSTYELYVENFGTEMGKGFQRITAIAAEGELSSLFGIPQGTPMNFIERETYSVSGEFLELMEMVSEYSQYEYTVSLDMGD